MAKSNKFGRRSIAAFWTLLFGVIVGTLIYMQRISILYVLVTLLLVLLLLVVAFADLENASHDMSESPRS